MYRFSLHFWEISLRGGMWCDGELKLIRHMKVCNVDMSPTLVSLLLRFVSIPSISQGSCRVCAVFVVLCFWGNSHTLYCVPTFPGNLSTQTLSLFLAHGKKSRKFVIKIYFLTLSVNYQIKEIPSHPRPLWMRRQRDETRETGGGTRWCIMGTYCGCVPVPVLEWAGSIAQ